jgi:hypothetical protein
LLRRIENGDVDAKEIYVGVSDVSSTLSQQLNAVGATVAGVKATAKSVLATIDKHSTVKA